MSRTGVIVALVITIALAIAGFFVLRSPPQASAPAGPLLEFDPAALTEIRIEHAGGRREVAQRTDAGGSWIIRIGDQPPWPAIPERIRAAIRILSTLEPVRPAEAKASTGADAATVTLEGPSGSDVTLRIASRAIGGAVLVSTEAHGRARAAFVDAAIADMLITTGLGPWRDPGAMGSLGADVSRAKLQGTQGTLELSRIRGRWGLTSPVAEIAESEAVSRLFSLIGQTKVVDFLDAGVPELTGLEAPIATLTLESDQRDFDTGELTTTRRTLEVGRTADVAGRTVFARLSGSSDPPAESGGWARTVIVDAQPLAEISTKPETYISRRSVQLPPADVGIIRVITPSGAAREFRRTLDGWARSTDQGRTAPLAAPDGSAIAKLLELLAATPAAAVSLQAPVQTATIARVELRTLGDDPIATIELAAIADGRLAALNGPIWRLYPLAGSEPLIQWLVPE